MYLIFRTRIVSYYAIGKIIWKNFMTEMFQLWLCERFYVVTNMLLVLILCPTFYQTWQKTCHQMTYFSRLFVPTFYVVFTNLETKQLLLMNNIMICLVRDWFFYLSMKQIIVSAHIFSSMNCQKFHLLLRQNLIFDFVS